MPPKAKQRQALPQHMTVSKTGVFGYRRRVPPELRDTVGVREIKKSLGRDYVKALQKHAAVNAEVEKMLAAKPHPKATERAKIMAVMERHGFNVADLIALQGGMSEENENLSYAFDAVIEELEKTTGVSEDALVGVARGYLPATLEVALDEYGERRKTGKAVTDRQIETRIERHKARLIKYLGDDKVTRRPLRLLKRVEVRPLVEGLLSEMSAASARRYMNDLSGAVSEAIREWDLEMVNPFHRWNIQGARARRDDREPLDEADMEALAPVMETEDDLGLIWLLLRDTGARLGEVTGLLSGDVDAKRRTINIRGNAFRDLKTERSEREVPIPDAILERIKNAKGDLEKSSPLFPQYAKPRGNDSCSQALMKRLRKVVTDPKKVGYSVRHRMKDRLRDVDCPEHLAREIMGHSEQDSAANYGRGTSLEVKRKWLEKAWSQERI